MLISTHDRPISWTMEGSPLTRVEPLTLALLKKHLRFTSSSEDGLIGLYLGAARDYFEEQTGRQGIQGVREYSLDRAPCARVLEIPRPPLVDVEAITYTDAAGETQTLDEDTYRVFPSLVTPDEGDPSSADPHCAPGRVELMSGAVWPTTNGSSGSLRIRYTCGYGATADDVPPSIQAVLSLIVGHLFRHRAEVVSGVRPEQLPFGAKAMIEAFKWTALPVQPPPHA